MKQILKLSRSFILLLDIFNLVFEDSPEFAILDPFYLLDVRSRHCQLELDLDIPPLLASHHDIEDHAVVNTLDEIHHIFPMLGELI